MNPVLRTVLQRLGLGIATLFVVSIIISLTIQMLPGSQVQILNQIQKLNTYYPLAELAV